MSLLVRKCFCCERELKPEEFFHIDPIWFGDDLFKAMEYYKRERNKKERLWNDLNVELFCCACYEAITYPKIEIKDSFRFLDSKHVIIYIDKRSVVIFDFFDVKKETLEKQLTFRDLLNSSGETIFC